MMMNTWIFNNGANLIDEIQANTIMLFAGKFIFNESQLFVSVYFFFVISSLTIIKNE